MTILSEPKQRRSAQDTRDRILATAINRFTVSSYDTTTLRKIAEDAGIDVALIARYFGSKEGLYSEVVRTTFSPTTLLAGGREDFGERSIRLLLDGEDDHELVGRFKIMLYALGSPAATRIIKDICGTHFHDPLAKWLGGEDADFRAHVIAAILTGLQVNRRVSTSLENASHKNDFSKRLGAIVQQWVDGTPSALPTEEQS